MSADPDFQVSADTLTGDDRGGLVVAVQDEHQAGAGPGLAGVIVGAASAPLGLLVAVAGYLGSAAWVAAITYRQPRPETFAERDLVREVKTGLGFLLHHQLMRTMVATSASLNLFASISGVALIAFMANDLRLPPGMMGVLVACTGVGGVTGGMLVAAVSRRLEQGRSAWISAALLGLPVLVMPLAHRDWRLWVLGAALFCTAFGGNHLQRDRAQLPAGQHPGASARPSQRLGVRADRRHDAGRQPGR